MAKIIIAAALLLAALPAYGADTKDSDKQRVAKEQQQRRVQRDNDIAYRMWLGSAGIGSVGIKTTMPGFEPK